MTQNTRGVVRIIAWYVWIAIIVGSALFPLYWVINCSFQSPIEIFETHLLPPSPTLEAYQASIVGQAGRSGLPIAASNTIVVATSAMVLSVCLGIMGGYALSRLRWRWAPWVLGALLVTQLIPPLTDLIPIFIVYDRLGLVNTKLGLCLAYTAWLSPITVWIIRSYFMSLPVELEEAATIDGCSRTGALLRIVLPLALPGIGSAAIFVFMSSFNEFFFAVIFTQTSQAKTIPVFLSEQVGKFTINYANMSASLTLSIIIPVVLALALHRFFVKGLTAGAVKG